jgi:hypothetical protein
MDLKKVKSFFGTFSKNRHIDDGHDRANRIYAPVVLIARSIT